MVVYVLCPFRFLPLCLALAARAERVRLRLSKNYTLVIRGK